MSFIKNKSQNVFGRFFSLLKKSKDQIAQSEEKDVNEQLIMQLNKKKIPSPGQLKQLPKFLSKGEKIQFIVAILIFLTASFGLGWRYYVKNSIMVPNYGGTYTEGMVGAPSLVNPILATSDVDRDLTKLIFSGLMKQNANNELVPDLASAYSIDVEETSYTFELRDDLHWHDGHPLTASDVVFTINNIKNPEYKSPYRASFNGVSVRAINDKTVQFRLEKPFAAFLSVLTIGIIPEHLWYSIPAFGANLADLNIRPIGSGPYQFKSLTRESTGSVKIYELESYEDYHLGRAYIDELHFKFYPDFVTAVTALQNKNIDGLIYLPKEYKEDLVNSKLSLHNLQFPQYTAIFFNPENNKMLEHNNFRQALALAINKQRILDEVLAGDGQIINAPILPGLPGYDASLTGHQFDPEAAKTLLDELGWVMPEEGDFRIDKNAEVEEGEETPVLTLKLSTLDQNENVKTASIIKESWESIGVKTELDIVAKDKVKKDLIEPRNYETLIYGQVVNTSSGPYPFWHSSQNKNPGLNLSVLANKDIDDALDVIKNAKNLDAEMEPLQNFQNKLLELNFAIFLYNPTYTYPTADNLKGVDSVKFINLPSDRFNDVTSWYIKTRRILSHNN